MIKFLTKSFLCTLVLSLFLSSGIFAQGATTGKIGGKVMDTNNEDIIGANVVATHVPTGTRYGSVTGVDGSYFIPIYAGRRTLHRNRQLHWLPGNE